jgi:phosphate transport system permease protein
MISLEFLTRNPVDMGKAGGIFSTIVGTWPHSPGGSIGTRWGRLAIFLSEYTRNWVTRVIRFGSECLAGIPSIIFGLFGFILFVTKLGLGWSLLSGGLTLAFMILPTIIRTSEEAIRSVPYAYRESASRGTRWQTVTKVVLPARCRA